MIRLSLHNKFIATVIVCSLVLMMVNIQGRQQATEPQCATKWSGKDLLNLSTEEELEFLSYKEAQYERRRQRVKRVCNALKKKSQQQSTVHPSRTSTVCESGGLQNCLILIDKKDGLGYCRIPKVASSTWLMRFKMMRAAEEEDSAIQQRYPVGANVANWTLRNNFDLHVESLGWWHEDSRSYASTLPSVLSFVVFRHPFDRLVSAYHDKMINCARIGMRPYVTIAREIIRAMRSDDEETNALTVFQRLALLPTPSEFVRYVVESHKNSESLDEVNEHWRLQASICPMCAEFDYSVYGRYEELEEDTAYVVIRAGRKGLFTSSSEIKINGGDERRGVRRRKFWSQVDEGLRRELAEVYRLDLDLMGYSDDAEEDWDSESFFGDVI